MSHTRLPSGVVNAFLPDALKASRICLTFALSIVIMRSSDHVIREQCRDLLCAVAQLLKNFIGVLPPKEGSA